MIKDCTSVEQGRMLVALGISTSTADKCWIAMESGKDEPGGHSRKCSLQDGLSIKRYKGV